MMKYIKPSRCGFDAHWRELIIYLSVYFGFFLRQILRQSAEVSSATQPPEFGGKQETECLNIGFPLPNQLCAGYLKLIFFGLFFLCFDKNQRNDHNRIVHASQPTTPR